MLNAINKLCIAGALTLMLGACGGGDRDEASKLLSQSEAAVASGNYSGALTLLDTLNSRYSEEIAVRRDGLRVRAMAMEGLARDSISAADTALAQATIDVEEYAPKFRHVDSSVGLEGYYLPTGVNEKVMTTSGIQARVSDKGFFYIVANVQGRSIGLNRIELIDGLNSVSSAELSPVRIIKVEGSESASFNPEELEAFSSWLISNPKPTKAILRGTKGSVDVKLSPSMAEELVLCVRYSEALQAHRIASIKREKYERMLATARDQIANLMPAQEQK